MNKIFYFCIFCFFFISCKKNAIVPSFNESSETENKLENFETKNEKISGCYLFSKDSSIVEMEIINEGEQFSGKLRYALFEKDANQGTFKGSISNDILIANYTFMSEGIESTRQIAFLIKNSKLIEGFGEVETNDKVTTFKNKDSLNFSADLVLEKTDCSTLKGINK